MNIWMMPMQYPAQMPPIRPLQVFPSPRMRLPFQLLPKSIGMPPPKMTAAELGTKAGTITQKPRRSGEDIVVHGS